MYVRYAQIKINQKKKVLDYWSWSKLKREATMGFNDYVIFGGGDATIFRARRLAGSFRGNQTVLRFLRRKRLSGWKLESCERFENLVRSCFFEE